MLKSVLSTGDVLACGTCLDARGLTDNGINKGVKRSTMAELKQVTSEADKVLVF